MSLTKVTNSMIQSAPVNVLDYLTAAQITAVLAYSFGTNVTTACQAALDAARAANLNCYFPAGGYLVTGLTIPGTTNPPTVDNRNGGMIIYGQSVPEAFVSVDTGGTILKSVTNAPVLQDIIGATPPQSNGTTEVCYLRISGNSTTPVVLLQAFGTLLSHFHHCTVYQAGVGDGVKITYSAGGTINNVVALNRDWPTTGLGAARVGIGFNYPLTNDSGLVSFSKCTSRGFLTGYSLGGGAGAPISTTVEMCECSVNYNGIIIGSTCNKTILDSNYFEGQEGGKGITNSGKYSTITNNLIFSGCSFCIDSRAIQNQGAVITGNTINLGNVVSAQGIALAGAFGQEVTGNSIACTDGTASQIGIFVDVSGKVDVHANAFDPKETWTGASASKVAYTSTSLIQGIITGQSNNVDFPILSQGAVSLAYAPLTGANVAANVLTVPDGGYFVVTAAGAVTVNSLDAGIIPNRQMTFRTTNANMTFADTAQIFLSAAFTGPGTISFVVERTGGLSYAYETSRTVF
jgi:hypothetical protein